MADPPPYPGAPRWVKVFGTITIVLALLFVIGMIAGNGRHGPGRHHTPRSSVGQDAQRP